MPSSIIWACFCYIILVYLVLRFTSSVANVPSLFVTFCIPILEECIWVNSAGPWKCPDRQGGKDACFSGFLCRLACEDLGLFLHGDTDPGWSRSMNTATAALGSWLWRHFSVGRSPTYWVLQMPVNSKGKQELCSHKGESIHMVQVASVGSFL